MTKAQILNKARVKATLTQPWVLLIACGLTAVLGITGLVAWQVSSFNPSTFGKMLDLLGTTHSGLRPNTKSQPATECDRSRFGAEFQKIFCNPAEAHNWKILLNTKAPELKVAVQIGEEAGNSRFVVELNKTYLGTKQVEFGGQMLSNPTLVVDSGRDQVAFIIFDTAYLKSDSNTQYKLYVVDTNEPDLQEIDISAQVKNAPQGYNALAIDWQRKLILFKRGGTVLHRESIQSPGWESPTAVPFEQEV